MTEEKVNDGGSAFPLPHWQESSRGMSLRDYFAGQALIACRNHSNEKWLAERAYQIADAMLAARSAKT